MMQAMSEKNWDLAVQLRGKSFQRNLETYRMLTRYIPPIQYIKGTASSDADICQLFRGFFPC
jgi:hypothetical protein